MSGPRILGWEETLVDPLIQSLHCMCRKRLKDQRPQWQQVRTDCENAVCGSQCFPRAQESNPHGQPWQWGLVLEILAPLYSLPCPSSLKLLPPNPPLWMGLKRVGPIYEYGPAERPFQIQTAGRGGLNTSTRRGLLKLKSSSSRANIMTPLSDSL